MAYKGSVLKIITYHLFLCFDGFILMKVVYVHCKHFRKYIKGKEDQLLPHHLDNICLLDTSELLPVQARSVQLLSSYIRKDLEKLEDWR